MIQKGVRSVALFFTLVLSIGCSHDGVLEDPDSGITITTPEAIHGEVGHLVEFTIGDRAAPVTDQVVLRLEDRDISDAVLYLSLAHTSGHTGDLAELISLLKRATGVSLVSSPPAGVKQAGGVILSFGAENDPPFLTYLRIITVDGTVYWSVRGNLGTDRRDWFLTEVRKPPKVIDTRPAQVVSITYYADENLTILIVGSVTLGDTIYTKVAFSKDVTTPPIITSHVGLDTFQYRIRGSGVPVAQLQSGEAQPHQNDNSVFLCKYGVQVKDIGTFHTSVGDGVRVGSRLTIRTTQNFIGKVYTPATGEHSYRASVQPVKGVIVTIATGTRAGEYTTTDTIGQYVFPNVPGDTLHLRPEKEGFEPKEVIVHRHHPTTLPGATMNHYNDPQKTRGTILIGHVWSDEVRFIFEETVVVNDLLYVNSENRTRNAGGFYSQGVAVVYENYIFNKIYDETNDTRVAQRVVLGAIAHEIGPCSPTCSGLHRR